MNSHAKVRHAVAFGALWKTVKTISAKTGLTENEVLAELDQLNVTGKVVDNIYHYAMTARIKN